MCVYVSCLQFYPSCYPHHHFHPYADSRLLQSAIESTSVNDAKREQQKANRKSTTEKRDAVLKSQGEKG